MSGLRCRYCQINWPNEPESYEHCPVCREPTVYTQQEPIPDGEARVKTKHGDFGWWLYENGRV